MIDLHSHILPGHDDGARTVEDAREHARRAAEEGVAAIADTPHVRNARQLSLMSVSRNEPLKRLPPDFVITLTTPPPNRPYSAEIPAVAMVVS